MSLSAPIAFRKVSLSIEPDLIEVFMTNERCRARSLIVLSST
jgi:hypothetical protein